MDQNRVSFWKGVFLGFFIFLVFYLCSEPLGADNFARGEVSWRPIYVKIVD